MTEEQKNNQGVPSAPQGTAPQPQPPLGQAPQQPPVYQQQPQPAYPPAPLTQLTGGMKFGWFVVGALLGIGGIVISWLVNADKYPKVKSDALKWTVIGFVVWIVLGIIMVTMCAGMIATLVGSASAPSSYDYGDYYGTW